MEQDEKIKMENEVLSLKREYKHAAESLARIKSDTAEIIATRDRVTKEIDERNTELTSVLNEISQEKLTWALKKQSDLDELSAKNAAADNVLKLKEELNAQQEEIRKIEAKNVDVLNENRRLELKIKDEKTELESKQRQLDKDRKSIEEQSELTKKEIKEFKASVIKLIKTVENL